MGRICPFISGPIQVIEDGQWTGSAVFPVECLKERCIAWGVIGGPIQRQVLGCRLIERETESMSR
jgi:hypothetical protein